MSQLLKYVMISIFCVVLGAIVGILLYNHLSPLELARKGVKTTAKIEGAVKNPSPAAQGNNEKKAEGTSSQGDSPSKENPPSQHADKKEEAKNNQSQKEPAKEKDESTEYLRSLWPIKKPKPTAVSSEQESPLYFEGTNPYGPPPTYKEELLAETKALSLRGDPPPRIPEPLRTLPPEEQRLREDPPPLPSSSIYQVEIGQFSSLSKAQEARDILQSKGHEVDVYYTGPITNPDWFYVRLSAFFSKPQAYRKAQTIAILEKIVPSIVAVTRDVKKLR